jgi:DNA-binding NarL/FixJ family response regulator
MKKITILIAEDHALLREVWTNLLGEDPRFEVIGACGSGDDAIALAKQLRPDIVTMDIHLQGTDGFEATQMIRKFSPGSRILGVSMHTQPSYVQKMIKLGASGYVTKSSPAKELIHAIEEVHNKRKYICEEVRQILASQAAVRSDEQKGLNALSFREMEIIYQLKQGYSSKKIAENLNLSVKTIDIHRYNILKKLGVKNTAELVNFINANL